MKQYKLIKKYPNSPKLGTIASTDKDENIDYFNFTNGWIPKSGYLSYQEIENYPEYWEEVITLNPKIKVGVRIKFLKSFDWSNIGDVVTISHIYKEHQKNTFWIEYKRIDNSMGGFRFEGNGYYLDNDFELVDKEYEILSLLHSNGEIHSSNTHLNKNHFKRCLDAFNAGSTTWSIYSIKRLSDGEVFTIGDKVKCIHQAHLDEVSTIESISVKDTRCFISGMNMEYFQKINKVLTTEDGVDIFINDEVWYIKKNLKSTVYKKIVKTKRWNIKDWLYFSTKEAAEEYILMNKPVFSLEEIYSILYAGNIELIKKQFLNKTKDKLQKI